MKILDYFEHPKFGVIVSLASPEFDKLSNDEIKNRIGDRIAILDTDSHEKKWVKVSKIDIATSIIDKKNILICLANSIKLSDIKPNSNILFAVHDDHRSPTQEESQEVKHNSLI